LAAARKLSHFFKMPRRSNAGGLHWPIVKSVLFQVSSEGAETVVRIFHFLKTMNNGSVAFLKLPRYRRYCCYLRYFQCAGGLIGDVLVQIT